MLCQAGTSRRSHPRRLEDYSHDKKENRCTRYELVAGISGDSIHFLEEWESRKLPGEHIAQPHMQEYFAKTNPYHASPTLLKIY